VNYYTLPPSETLKPYVRCFWVLTHDLAADEPAYVYRSVADGCVEMVFHYQGDFAEIVNDGHEKGWKAGMHFQSGVYRRFITAQNFGIFGAYVYPYAIPQLLNMPSSEVTGEMLDVKELFGADGHRLEEEMMLAIDNASRARILSVFLEKRLLFSPVKDANIITAIHQVINHTPNIGTVNALADRFALSTRQFNRKFQEYAGFSPKMYLRLMRLRSALNQYGSDKSLTQIALGCGYYDQSHFIHDVKTFTGYHPGHYFSGRAEGQEYRNV
jgi:AraC-like DNA-binding protein